MKEGGGRQTMGEQEGGDVMREGTNSREQN